MVVFGFGVFSFCFCFFVCFVLFSTHLPLLLSTLVTRFKSTAHKLYNKISRSQTRNSCFSVTKMRCC